MSKEKLLKYDAGSCNLRTIGKQPKQIRGSYDIVSAAFDIMPAFAQEEHLAILLLDCNRIVLDSGIISIGSRTSCVADPASVFRHAITTCGCEYVALVHNHPNGDPTPSRADLDGTVRMIQAGEIMGITVIDHVVVGNGTRSYVSIRECLDNFEQEDKAV